jgi:hypothetical protein
MSESAAQEALPRRRDGTFAPALGRGPAVTRAVMTAARVQRALGRSDGS